MTSKTVGAASAEAIRQLALQGKGMYAIKSIRIYEREQQVGGMVFLMLKTEVVYEKDKRDYIMEYEEYIGIAQ